MYVWEMYAELSFSPYTVLQQYSMFWLVSASAKRSEQLLLETRSFWEYNKTKNKKRNKDSSFHLLADERKQRALYFSAHVSC